MPLTPRTSRAPKDRSTVAICLVAMLLVVLVASLGGGPGTALGADASDTPPSGEPSSDPTPTATPTPTPTPTPAPGPTVLGSTVTFFGRGYGHGVGMSQYGARGRALAGEDAATILAHYYRGATFGSVPATTRIRVRVLYRYRATSTKPLLVYGRRGTWTIDRVAATFPPDAALRVIPATSGATTTWRIRVTSAAGVVLFAGPKPASLVIRGAEGATRLELRSKASTYDEYRGLLRVKTASSAPLATVINDLPLETYIRGVVPVEMSSAWPPAALEAQTIASRSYAARHLRPGVSYYDVVDTSAAQVYHGAKGEKATTNAIIRTSAGVVLRSGTAIANTLYHSAGGGGTENNENVYTSATGARVAGVVSYLRGSMDRAPDGSSYDAASPYATWATRAYSRAQLSAWFAADSRTNVGTLTALDLRDRGVSGRLISVRLIGSAGTKKVSSAVFRSVFNAARPAGDPMLRSTLFATAPIP
ncbi:MAG: SpoIID/LytB domain-containing protein [Chloroflexota bacterium]